MGWWEDNGIGDSLVLGQQTESGQTTAAGGSAGFLAGDQAGVFPGVLPGRPNVNQPGGSGSFDEKVAPTGGGLPYDPGRIDPNTGQPYMAQATGGPSGGGGAAPPGGQNYQQIVEQLMGGSNDPNKLRQIAPELAKYGIKLSNANASGELSKIILPDGTAVRVIGAGEGHAVYLPQPGTGSASGSAGGGGGSYGGGGSQSNLSNPNDLTQGWTQSFQAPAGAPGADPFTEQFSAPTLEEARNTPGYQFALQQGLQGIERGAASKGTLLTGGTLKDETAFGTGLADQTYQQLYNNRRGEFSDRFNIHASNAANATSAYGNSYDRAMNEYLNAFNIFNTNQNNLFGRLSTVSGQGLAAAGGQAGAAQNIGQAGANANTGAGNAQAAGDITKGNANANEATTIGQLGSSFIDPSIYGGKAEPGVWY